MELITNLNYLEYLRQHYNKKLDDEFEEDINRIKYIKKLITRYLDYGTPKLRERLILNHIIILNNVFGPQVIVPVLFLRLSNMQEQLKPFLLLLSILPKYVENISLKDPIDTDLISMDPIIVERLRLL